LALDQPNLLCSAPTLELFLSVNGFEHVIERLVMDRAMTAVFLAEAIHQVILVFKTRRSNLLVIPM
jgi:hypothetical protein